MDSENSPATIWVLLSLIYELGIITALVYTLYYTVKHRSGLQEPDKIHRIWSRAEEIRYQPVEKPLVFSVAVAFGMQTVLHPLLVFGFLLLNIPAASGTFLGAVIVYLCQALGSAISIVLYRAAGGLDWKHAFLASSLFGVAMYTLVVASLDLYGQVVRAMDEQGYPGYESMVFLFLYVIIPSINVVIQFFASLSAASVPLPPTARKIYNSSVIPNWVKLDRTILMASGPLVVVKISAVLVDRLGATTYLTRLTNILSDLMLLAVSALVSIISVNRALLVNEFQWQWRAFLTPAVPLVICDFVILFVRMVFGNITFGYLVFQVLHLFLSYGSCGAFGAFVYLVVAEKYAQKYADEDYEGQTDFLADIGEDNEELEV